MIDGIRFFIWYMVGYVNILIAYIRIVLIKACVMESPSLKAMGLHPRDVIGTPRMDGSISWDRKPER